MTKTHTNNQDATLEFLADGFLDYLATKIEGPENEELDALLDEQAGFSDDFKKKAKELFWEAVENQNPHVWPLRAGLAELLQIYWPLVEGSDVVGIALERIEELEAQIAEAEAENYRLVNEKVEKFAEQYQLSEDTVISLWNASDTFEQLDARLQQAAKPERAPRKSYVEEDMEALNEDGAFGQENGYVGDPRMRAYLKALGEK
jgi:hypothetical protein